MRRTTHCDTAAATFTTESVAVQTPEPGRVRGPRGGVRLGLVTISILLGAVGMTAAQATGQGAPQGPPAGADPDQYVLRQEVRAVILDVVVTSRDGRPITGLTQNDFRVTEDGVPQEIKSFQAPDAHALPAETRSKAESAPGGLVRGATGQSPTTILLLDEVSTGPEDLAYAKSEAERFLKAQSATLPQPTMLLILTATQLKVASDFTLDRDHLLGALKSDKGGASWYTLRDHTAGFQATGNNTSLDRLRIDLETVAEIAASNVARPGRKNLIWIGPGLPALSAENGSQRVRQVAGDAVRRASTMLLNARMTMYTVDPQGLLVTPTQTIDPSSQSAAGAVVATAQDPQESELVFEQLAVETGGKIYRMRNDVDAEIGEGIRDGATYYTLSYTPSNHDFNGKYRRIGVTIGQPGLEARTRKGYDAAADVKPTEAEVETTLALALTSTLHYDAIPVSARRLAGSGGAEAARLEISAGLGNVRFRAAANGKREADVEIVTGLVADNGQVTESHRVVQRATMANEADPAVTGPAKATFTVPFPPAPAAGQKVKTVRVLVRDRATGAIGSYDLPFAAG